MQPVGWHIQIEFQEDDRPAVRVPMSDTVDLDADIVAPAEVGTFSGLVRNGFRNT